MSTTREDRVKGVMLGMATGDALGVPYETGRRVPASGPVMSGGGYGFAPGEWSDDTQQAVCVLKGMSDPERVAENLLAWYRGGPADVGPTSGLTLSAADRAERRNSHEKFARVSLADVMTEAAHKARIGRTEGEISNGSLMRTGPLALPFIGNRPAIALAARRISDLTHADPWAGDACVLWSLAIGAAVEGAGEFPYDHSAGALVLGGLEYIPQERRTEWRKLIAKTLSYARHPSRIGAVMPEAPAALTSNLNVIKAFQAALYAVELGKTLPDTLVKAVRIGGDTDTVAAIAGALAGAIYGAQAVPSEWREQLHGWPGEIKASDLEQLAVDAAFGSSGEHGELGTDDPEMYQS